MNDSHQSQASAEEGVTTRAPETVPASTNRTSASPERAFNSHTNPLLGSTTCSVCGQTVDIFIRGSSHRSAAESLACSRLRSALEQVKRDEERAKHREEARLRAKALRAEARQQDRKPWRRGFA